MILDFLLNWYNSVFIGLVPFSRKFWRVTQLVSDNFQTPGLASQLCAFDPFLDNPPIWKTFFLDSLGKI